MGVDEIDIQLERGVYYAGEVVRGSVKLRVSNQVSCRGFHIRCLGYSYVHWHTGVGKHRHDYRGKTFFQWQQTTLIGNFYRTGRLDDAGENAFFNKVYGNGVMYIPCSAQEENAMSLIVRVMDYDFGKSDDLLGEVVVDVAELVRSKQLLSYRLTRNGKEEQGEVTLSAKLVPSDQVFPPASNSGESMPSQKPFCLVLTAHKATGLRKADLIGGNDVYVQAYRFPNTEFVIRSGETLPPPETTTILPDGETTYGFSFVLPPSAPGSAELGVADCAFVRYDLCAFADMANWRDPSRTVTITVIPSRPVPSLQLLQPRKTEICHQEMFGFVCLGLKSGRKDGFVSAALTTDRQAYAPGEAVDLAGSYVTNDTNEELSINILLRLQARMSSSPHRWVTKEMVFRICEAKCAPTTTVDLQTMIGTKLKIPAVYPSFDGGIDESERHACLRFTYTLEMNVGGNGFWESAVKVAHPILISAAPPYPEAVEKAKSLPAVEETIVDPFSFLKLAHWSLEPSETTPFVTGPEDGGQHTAAITFESGVNNTVGEDNLGQIGDNPIYVPHVNVFDTPLAVIKDSSDTPSASSSVSEAVNIDSLLMSMQGSADVRRVVKEWIKEHGSETKRLLPEQVFAIMNAVSFSPYHQSVASELANGIAPALTCQHIASAIRVCGYQKADVAKVMAPFACDPQNKQMVLDELGFEYEKESVSAVFRA